MTKLAFSQMYEPDGVTMRPFDLKMAKSDAVALALVSVDGFGADLIRFPPGGCVKPHTHPGDHILVCATGAGRLWYDGEEHRLSPGFVYFVPGSVPHAIYADADSPTDLILLSVANRHIPAAAPERLELVQNAAG